MKKKYILLVLSFFLIIMLVDCRCQHSDLVVNKVIFEMPEKLLKFAASQNLDLKILVGQALDFDRHIRVNADNSEAGVLKISILMSPTDKELVLVANLLRDNYEQVAFSDVALGEASIEPEKFKKALSTSVASLRQQLLGAGTSNMSYLAKLQQASLGEFVDAEVNINAVRVAGEKRDKEALPLLIKILGTTDNLGIANACLMALAQLKDASALPAIIDFAESKPALIRRQAILAARQIPCKLSAEWLVVMAYGHDDPMVRKDALEGLLEVEQELLGQK